MSRRTETREVISDPSLRSHVIKVTKPNKEVFFIPVVDARDGEEQREAIRNSLKTDNKRRGSAYMKPTYTNVFGDSYNERGGNKFFPKRKEDAESN